MAALNIDYGRREFILDSGADIWHLRASNESEFEIWKTRLEDVWLKAVAGRQRALQSEEAGLEISTDWKKVEGLVDRLSMMKDFVGGMVTDLATETAKAKEVVSVSSTSAGKAATAGGKDEQQKERMKIFKRNKDKTTTPTSPPRDSPNHPMNAAEQTSHGNLTGPLRKRDTYTHLEPSVVDSLGPKLMSLDQNLESILTSFQTILSNLRPTMTAAVASPVLPSRRVSIGSARRMSLDSTAEDWFDAQSIAEEERGLITVVEQESEGDNRHDETSEDDDDIAQLREGAISPLLTMAPNRLRTAVKKELYPLGTWRERVVKRRKTLPQQIIIPPPSLIAFLRKNVRPLDFQTYVSRLVKISAQ